MRNPWILTALACAALTVITGCQAGPRQNAAPAATGPVAERMPVITQTEPRPIAQILEGKTDVHQLTITPSGFSPAEIRTTVNQRVRIHLKNADSKPHNLVIERFHIATGPVAPGAEDYIEFTAGEAGRWPMISDLPGAPEPGLKATLVVE